MQQQIERDHPHLTPSLSVEQEHEFMAFLGAIDGSKDSITTARTWILQHAAGFEPRVADLLALRMIELTRSSFDSKLYLIYFIHDVLQWFSMQRERYDVIDSFAAALGKHLLAICYGACHLDRDKQESVLQVVRLWPQRGVYPEAFVDALLTRVTGNVPCPYDPIKPIGTAGAVHPPGMTFNPQQGYPFVPQLPIQVPGQQIPKVFPSNFPPQHQQPQAAWNPQVPQMHQPVRPGQLLPPPGVQSQRGFPSQFVPQHLQQHQHHQQPQFRPTGWPPNSQPNPKTLIPPPASFRNTPPASNIARRNEPVYDNRSSRDWRSSQWVSSNPKVPLMAPEERDKFVALMKEHELTKCPACSATIREIRLTDHSEAMCAAFDLDKDLIATIQAKKAGKQAALANLPEGSTLSEAVAGLDKAKEIAVKLATLAKADDRSPEELERERARLLALQNQSKLRCGQCDEVCDTVAVCGADNLACPEAAIKLEEKEVEALVASKWAEGIASVFHNRVFCQWKCARRYIEDQREDAAERRHEMDRYSKRGSESRRRRSYSRSRSSSRSSSPRPRKGSRRKDSRSRSRSDSTDRAPKRSKSKPESNDKASVKVSAEGETKTTGAGLRMSAQEREAEKKAGILKLAQLVESLREENRKLREENAQLRGDKKVDESVKSEESKKVEVVDIKERKRTSRFQEFKDTVTIPIPSAVPSTTATISTLAPLKTTPDGFIIPAPKPKKAATSPLPIPMPPSSPVLLNISAPLASSSTLQSSSSLVSACATSLVSDSYEPSSASVDDLEANENTAQIPTLEVVTITATMTTTTTIAESCTPPTLKLELEDKEAIVKAEPEHQEESTSDDGLISARSPTVAGCPHENGQEVSSWIASSTPQDQYGDEDRANGEKQAIKQDEELRKGKLDEPFGEIGRENEREGEDVNRNSGLIKVGLMNQTDPTNTNQLVGADSAALLQPSSSNTRISSSPSSSSTSSADSIPSTPTSNDDETLILLRRVLEQTEDARTRKRRSRSESRSRSTSRRSRSDREAQPKVQKVSNWGAPASAPHIPAGSGNEKNSKSRT